MWKLEKERAEEVGPRCLLEVLFGEEEAQYSEARAATARRDKEQAKQRQKDNNKKTEEHFSFTTKTFTFIRETERARLRRQPAPDLKRGSRVSRVIE